MSLNYTKTSGFNILVIDDSKVINAFLITTLDALGCKCKSAFTCKEALEQIEQNPFDIIILDLHLPDGEGEELFYDIKKSSSAKIIVFTSDNDLCKRDFFFQNGALDYILKDAPAALIQDDIKRVLHSLSANRSVSILAIDDSMLVRKALQMLIEPRNYIFDSAKTAQEGLSKINSLKPDIVILDYILPDGDGLDVLSKMKTSRNGVNSKVFMLSGTHDPSVVSKAYKLGCVEFIAKPFISEEIVRKIDSWASMILEAESNLKNSVLLQQYRYMVDSSVIVSKTDPKGIITYVNEAFCRVSGFKEEELLGRPHNIVRHPDMPSGVFKELWETIKQDKQWRGIVKNRTRDGGAYWVNTVISPISNEDGEIVEYIAMRDDITETIVLNMELNEQKAKIQEEHNRTQESIQFAAAIQHALIPYDSVFDKCFKDYFKIWLPKDIVSGDIYCADELSDDEDFLIMLIDCSGHGVPGAFLTVLVKSLQKEILLDIKNKKLEPSPAKILQKFNVELKKILAHDSTNNLDIGFDGCVIYYNKKTAEFKFAGAKTSIFYVENSEILEIKGDRHSIGYKNSNPNFEFKDKSIDICSIKKFYITTDGYLDQTGGDDGFSFGKSSFKKLVSGIKHLNMIEQRSILIDALVKYQQNEIRNDDITLIGFELN